MVRRIIASVLSFVLLFTGAAPAVQAETVNNVNPNNEADPQAGAEDADGSANEPLASDSEQNVPAENAGEDLVEEDVIEEKGSGEEQKEEEEENVPVNQEEELNSDSALEGESESQDENSLPSSRQAVSKSLSDNIVEEGNIKYYLNSGGEIIYAEVFENGKLVSIQEYYPKTLVKDLAANIKIIYYISADNFIEYAKENAQGTQETAGFIEYFPNTVFGNHVNRVKQEYNVKADYIVESAERNESGQIIRHYEYYPQTNYENKNNRVKYIFELDRNGNVTEGLRN